MKQIVKGEQPALLAIWKDENANIPKLLRYSALHGEEKRAIRSQMLLEQGYLCAYTMIRLEGIDACHIEHIEPQTQSIQNGNWLMTIEYTNMLACFPGMKPPPEYNPKYPYGATCKDGQHLDSALFLSPLHAGVEMRFAYRADGRIEAIDGDLPAAYMISLLGLDQDQLIELRKAAIEEWVLDEAPTVQEAIDLSHSSLFPDDLGRLPEFCLAISQVATWYASVLTE